MATPIDISEQAGIRYLHFGSAWIQGAMRITTPDALELDYTREMMAGLLLRDGLNSDGGAWPRRVLIVGLGTASLVKFLHRHCPWARMEVVEIEPAVLTVARQFFCLPAESERLRVCLGDGVRHVLESREYYDYVLVDGYDRQARAGGLDTQPFHQAVRARLSEEGLAVYNLLGGSKTCGASMERILTAYDARAFILPPCEGGNIVAFAAEGAPVSRPIAELRTRAAILKAQTGLDLLPTLGRIEAAGSVPGATLLI
ncbi:MAG: fused MFS/spermidine synthase [Azoarcus sp.]|jgi:spermidine synthase|nr:fused MFS/spermidine synthase [Azoarcus sp.]